MAGNKLMAEQEPLTASVAVVMFVPRKGMWPKDKPGASVAVDKALKHQCLFVGLCWSTSEPRPWINSWESSYSLGGTAAVGKATSIYLLWMENFIPYHLYKIMFVKV